ncbi:MAG: hypothetical protein Ta2E_01360 [Mycoplasmoidaceae bacterium]|nr:MAG: hypothetical protein Ta2E_01360 [Mycoplasmoidaceae bacterium]
MLIVCHELQSIDNAKHLNTDYLKTLITDKHYTRESKYLNTRSIENISNSILVSNNFLPIKIENGDWRNVILKCSETFKNNFEYFEKLNDTFTESFYFNLHMFFKTYDIIKINPRTISISDIKLEMIDACKESWLLFFEYILDNFKIRYECNATYLDYCKFCETERYQAFSNKAFKQKLLRLFDEHRTT